MLFQNSLSKLKEDYRDTTLMLGQLQDTMWLLLAEIKQQDPAFKNKNVST